MLYIFRIGRYEPFLYIAETNSGQTAEERQRIREVQGNISCKMSWIGNEEEKDWNYQDFEARNQKNDFSI